MIPHLTSEVDLFEKKTGAAQVVTLRFLLSILCCRPLPPPPPPPPPPSPSLMCGGGGSSSSPFSPVLITLPPPPPPQFCTNGRRRTEKTVSLSPQRDTFWGMRIVSTFLERKHQECENYSKQLNRLKDLLRIPYLQRPVFEEEAPVMPCHPRKGSSLGLGWTWASLQPPPLPTD